MLIFEKTFPHALQTGPSADLVMFPSTLLEVPKSSFRNDLEGVPNSAFIFLVGVLKFFTTFFTGVPEEFALLGLAILAAVWFNLGFTRDSNE